MTFEQEIKESLQVLGLENQTSLDENTLKKAYLKMSKKYHPDVCEEKYKDGVMFKKVNDANTFLKDNLSAVNDYFQNPEKYRYEQHATYSQNAQSASYQYQNFNDFFAQFFRAYQRQNSERHQYTAEELKEMEKRRKKYILKRRIIAGAFMAASIALCFVIPGIGIPMALFSLFYLI